MPGSVSNQLVICAGAAFMLAASGNVNAQSLPAVVVVPKAINLGSTSFFDGIGRQEPGFTLLEYDRMEDLNRITTYNGSNNPLFTGPKVHAYVLQIQPAYIFPWDPLGLGGHLGFNALQAFTGFSSGFNSTSPVKLTNNGFGLGDLTWGPIYQSKIYKDDTDRPVFAWRVQLGVYSPTGSVNTSRNINQGNGFWAFNPYFSFTYLPAPNIEISSRINYQYNFATSVIQAPPPIPGVTYYNGQAGSMIYGNLAASYAIVPDKLYFGVNSFGVAQLTNDRTNGIQVANSREYEFSIGPGGRVVFTPFDAVNFNVYFPVVADNSTSGTVFNFQYVHRF